MGVQRCRPFRWTRAIGDQGGAARADAGKAHALRVANFLLAADLRQRVIQPPVQPAPAAMKPRKAAISMAQRPQGRADTGNRLRDRARHKLFAAFNRGLRPQQQRQNVQQFLGIARRDTAVSANLAGAIRGERGNGRGGQMLHPLQRQARIDHAGQRLEPGKAGAGAAPAARQEQRLLPKRAKQPRLCVLVLPAQQENPMRDPANQAPPGQVRRPTGASAVPKSVDPFRNPSLRRMAGAGIANSGQIIKPSKAVQFLIDHRPVALRGPD